MHLIALSLKLPRGRNSIIQRSPGHIPLRCCWSFHVQICCLESCTIIQLVSDCVLGPKTSTRVRDVFENILPARELCVVEALAAMSTISLTPVRHATVFLGTMRRTMSSPSRAPSSHGHIVGRCKAAGFGLLKSNDSQDQRCFFSSVALFLCSLCENQRGRLLMSHAPRRRPDVADKGGSGPSSAMNKCLSAQHHSAQRCRSIATQTDDFVPAATYAATASPGATYAATAASPMVEYVDPAPVVTYAAPAPVIEYIAPAPAMTYDASCQQLLPAYTSTTDTTDDNFDITDLVHTQFSSTAVGTFAPQVVVSLPSLRNRFLQVRRLRTLRKSLLCNNR